MTNRSRVPPTKNSSPDAAPSKEEENLIAEVKPQAEAVASKLSRGIRNAGLIRGLLSLAGVLLGVSYLALVFFMMFLNCNVLAVFSLLFISPLMPGVHHRLITDLFGVAFKCFVFWGQVVGGLRPIYYGEGVNSLLEKDKKSKLIIGNHLSFVDTFCLISMGHAAGEVQGMRAFTKGSIKWGLPIIGWSAAFVNFIFLRRNFEKDKALIKAQMKALAANSKFYSSGNFWLVIFPEGTRATPDKLEAAKAFARSRDLPVLHHLLVPRTKGLLTVLGEGESALRESADSVLDVTFGYPCLRGEGPQPKNVLPSMVDLFFDLSAKNKPHHVHVHIRTIPLSDVPKDKEGLESWTSAVFQEKDKLLDHYQEHGCFPGEARELPLASWHTLMANLLLFCLSGAAVALFLFAAFKALELVAGAVGAAHYHYNSGELDSNAGAVV